MGNGASSSNSEADFDYPKLNIAEISRESKLGFVAVLREWQRWKDLGSDNEGNIHIIKLRESYPDDLLMYRIIDSMPSVDNRINFVDFCRFLYVWQTMTMEEKLQSIFQILNNGDPLTEECITEVIKAVRPDKDDIDEVKTISRQMPESLNCLGTSVIDEEDFVSWAKKLPEDELEKRMNFVIIDPNIMEQLEMDERKD